MVPDPDLLLGLEIWGLRVPSLDSSGFVFCAIVVHTAHEEMLGGGGDVMSETKSGFAERIYRARSPW